MLHFSPRTLPLCVGGALSRCRGFGGAVKPTTPADGNIAAGGNGVIGCSFNALLCRNNTEGACSTSFGTNFNSRWNGVVIPMRRSTSSTRMLFSSSINMHGGRESTFSLRSVSLHASGSAASFTHIAALPTKNNAVYSRTSIFFGKIYLLPVGAAAFPVVKTATTTSCTGRSEVGREASTAVVLSSAALERKPAALRTADVTATPVLQRGERLLEKAADIAQYIAICATNKPAAPTEEPRSSRRLVTDAAVAQAGGVTHTLQTGRKATAEALHGVFTSIGGGIKMCGPCAVYKLKCIIAPGNVQALATCCYVQQQLRVDRVTEVVAGNAAIQRERGTPIARRRGSTDGERLVGTLELSPDPTKPGQKASPTCGSAFVRPRYMYKTAPVSRGRHGYPCIFHWSPLTSSLGDRMEMLKFFVAVPSLGSPESGRYCGSVTAGHKSETRPAAATSLPMHEGGQQRENGGDPAKGRSVFQPSPQGQALLGLLAALGACLSLVLLYERSLLDSAALLYGAWDTEWDASWRASAEEYDAEITGKGSQALPCVARDAKSGPGEVPTTPVRRPTRQVILVRHGQYRLPGTEDEGSLTDLGIRQAEAAGRRLRELLQGQRVEAIVHSNMKRARQTANIIHEAGGFKAVPLVEDALLAEGAPAEPVPPSDTFWPSPTDIAMDGPRIEQAFRRYFYRPGSRPTARTPSLPAASDKLSSTSEASADSLSASATGTAAGNTSTDVQASQRVLPEDSFIIVVCHGNVIRYFLMRALQLPACAWLRWALFNTGLTWISIDAKGRVSCRNFGDVGHLPANMISYN